MFTKFASLEVLEVKSSAQRQATASLTKFADYDDYRTDDGYVYVRVRAISSRVNKNHDGWPSSELSKAYRTFIGKPIFVDHHNTDPKKARGVIVDAAIHVDDSHTASLDPYYASAPAEHLPPTWIELLLEVDAKRFPKLAKAIIDGDIDGVSMGANVEISKCSHCGNEARAPEQYCKHVQSKGAYFDFYAPNGQKTSKKAYEDCYDIGFFEISFVFDPADETALVSDIKHSKRMARIAAIRAEAEYTDDTGRGHKAPQIAEFEQGLLQQFGQDGIRQIAEALRSGALTSDALGAPVRGVTARVVTANDLTYIAEVLGGVVAIFGAAGALTALGEWWGDGGSPSPRVRRLNHDVGEAALRSVQHPQEPQDPQQPTASTKTASKTAERNPGPQSEMTTAPDKVDTLRQEQICPICGSDMDDGVCEVCNYEEPPEGFDNPDLSKAKEVDEQIHQQDAQQAADGTDPNTPNDVTPGPGGAPAPLPSGAMPATSSTSKTGASATVSIEKTSAQPGRINTQERPILPATRQLSDKPIGQKTVSEAKKPVESSIEKETMSDQTQKTADGATAQGEGVQAEKRVDVEGVGAVSGDPLSGIEHENVEKDTGDFTAPHTDTWSDGEGDSLGQQDAVTSETGDFFTVSAAEDAAGEEAGSTGGAQAGGSTWDSAGGFPDHDPTRVDVAAPLKEEVGEGTSTDSSEEFRSLKHTEPVTKDNANELGGPIGTAVASAKAQIFKAMKVADTEISLGLTDADKKFARIAELEDTPEAALDAQLATLARVKTAGLKKAAPAQQKTAGRVPSFKPVTGSFDIEANAVDDDAFGDSIF